MAEGASGHEAWGSNGTICFSKLGEGLASVPAEGGEVAPVTTAEDGTSHWQPHVLPDASAILFATLTFGQWDSAQIVWRSLTTGEQKVLLRGSEPSVTSSGHLLFFRDEAVWAIRFDAERAETIGAPQRVIEGVRRARVFAQYRVSDEGTLIYWRTGTNGSAFAQVSSLVWIDPSGNQEPLPIAKGFYMHPRISPDGQRIAMTVGQFGESSIWVYSVPRDTMMRLTFGSDYGPAWFSDGTRVAFTRTSDFRDTKAMYKVANGTGDAIELTSHDGIMLDEPSPAGGPDLTRRCGTALSDCDLWIGAGAKVNCSSAAITPSARPLCLPTATGSLTCLMNQAVWKFTHDHSPP